MASRKAPEICAHAAIDGFVVLPYFEYLSSILANRWNAKFFSFLIANPKTAIQDMPLFALLQKVNEMLHIFWTPARFEGK
jgi:hypothetical protein